MAQLIKLPQLVWVSEPQAARVGTTPTSRFAETTSTRTIATVQDSAPFNGRRHRLNKRRSRLKQLFEKLRDTRVGPWLAG
jgi:hypothetical protein